MTHSKEYQKADEIVIDEEITASTTDNEIINPCFGCEERIRQDERQKIAEIMRQEMANWNKTYETLPETAEKQEPETVRKSVRTAQERQDKAVIAKDEEVITTPETASRFRSSVQHLECSGCPDVNRKKCVMEGFAATECYLARNKREVKA